KAKQLGVLVASGLIVGESIFGVVIAGLIVATSRAMPLAVVGDAFTSASNWLGGIAFVLLLAGLYRWTSALTRR
ncbi:MAG: oligopeptide transporter, OPT family, partial [Candidatus Eremiobacteraeota bacterium]|nr:oligopeptide transporter, OPT family [Candidatus Eremiobacteraeota bacterium]